MEQQNKPEEKFVTIQYDLWNSKYKPMEETNIQLLETLKREREEKKAEIYLHYFNYGHSTVRSIGYLDINTQFYHPSWRCKEYITEAIQNLLKDAEFPYYSTRKDAEEMYNKLLKEQEIKTNLIKLNERMFSKIPRIIRWLFKIKI